MRGLNVPRGTHLIIQIRIYARDNVRENVQWRCDLLSCLLFSSSSFLLRSSHLSSLEILKKLDENIYLSRLVFIIFPRVKKGSTIKFLSAVWGQPVIILQEYMSSYTF
jgi:hypothetical protein